MFITAHGISSTVRPFDSAQGPIFSAGYGSTSLSMQGACDESGRSIESREKY